MFELNHEEKNELVTNCDRLINLRHSSVNPMAFTEQGVAMLSTVLRSEKAIQVNIEIMRAFARYRAILKETANLRNTIRSLDDKLNNAIQFLLERIDELHQSRTEALKPVGFKYNKGLHSGK
jgi:hypothetical protein